MIMNFAMTPELPDLVAVRRAALATSTEVLGSMKAQSGILVR
jgi:hypothetical protein